MKLEITNFLAASKKYETLKEQMKQAKAELMDSMSVLGTGAHFQDNSDNTVFQIVRPTGTFITFDAIGYERTKREGEVKGSMSKKKAEELGYIL